MSTTTEKTAVDKAEEYYDSTPADEFYFKIWGGDHIHVGIYNHPKESIKDASPRIVQMMASKLKLKQLCQKFLRKIFYFYTVFNRGLVNSAI